MTETNARPPDSHNVSMPSERHSPFRRFLTILQTVAGITAIFLIPLLWGAWSQTVLIVVLGSIFAAAGIFAVANYLLASRRFR